MSQSFGFREVMETGRLEQDQVRNRGGERGIWTREMWRNCDVYVLPGLIISMIMTLFILCFALTPLLNKKHSSGERVIDIVAGIVNIVCLLPLLFVSVKRVSTFSLWILVDLVMTVSQCVCLIFVVISSCGRHKLSRNMKILECVFLQIFMVWNLVRTARNDRNQWYRQRVLKDAFSGIVGSTVGVRNALDEAKRLVRIEISLVREEEEEEIANSRDPNVDTEEGNERRIMYKQSLSQLYNRVSSLGTTLGKMQLEAIDMRKEMNQI